MKRICSKDTLKIGLSFFEANELMRQSLLDLIEKTIVTKRIIEEYHKGKIKVLDSEIGEGTTIRMRLNRL